MKTMKKLCVVLLALAICVSMAACGDDGLDRQPALDAYNRAAAALKEVGGLFAGDSDLLGEYEELSDMLEVCGEGLKGDDVTQEDLDELIEIFGEIEQWAVETKNELGG